MSSSDSSFSSQDSDIGRSTPRERDYERSSPRSPAQNKRPSRNKVLPSKYREGAYSSLEEIDIDPTRLTQVKCCQTGKQHCVKVKDLAREDYEPLTSSDLTKGSSLVMECKGKSYPVKFIQFMDKGSSTSRKTNENRKGKARQDKKRGRNEEEENEDERGQLRDRTNVVDVLSRAKDQENTPKRPRVEQDITILDNPDKDLMIDLVRRMEMMEKTMDKMLGKMTQMMELVKNGTAELPVKQEASEERINGVNVMRIPSRDAYAFGLQLMDILFTKEELAGSLLFQSKKSEKPGLNRESVEKLLGFLDKRYGDQWELKTLTAKANQKCRDAKERLTVKSTS